MTALAWLIPAALLLGLAGLGAFLWALRSGQFDDMDGAAYRILDDEEETGREDRSSDRAPGGQLDTNNEK